MSTKSITDQQKLDRVNVKLKQIITLYIDVIRNDSLSEEEKSHLREKFIEKSSKYMKFQKYYKSKLGIIDEPDSDSEDSENELYSINS